MKSFFLLLFALVSASLQAQYLKVDAGVVRSAFVNAEDLPILSSPETSYALHLGAEYGEHRWFSFSSQLGYLHLGGYERNTSLPAEQQKIRERKGHLQVATTFRPYRRTGASTFFVGVGPTLTVRSGRSTFASALYHDYRYTRVRSAGKLKSASRRTSTASAWGW